MGWKVILLPWQKTTSVGMCEGIKKTIAAVDISSVIIDFWGISTPKKYLGCGEVNKQLARIFEFC